ncbi:MAG: tetratricopeptide repeat protein, partial [Bacteroidota bacterium]
MKIVSFLALIFTLLGSRGFSQNPVDSLLTVYRRVSEEDSTFVDLTNKIAYELSYEDPKKSLYYLKEAQRVSDQIGYKKGTLRALITLGNSYMNAGLPDQALVYYLEALYQDASNYPREYAILHNNIGEVYRRREIYDSSKKYFSKALYLARENVADFDPSIIYSNLGEVSLNLNQIETAREYFEKCLTSSSQKENNIGLGYSYFGLAECFAAERRFDSAKVYQRRSLNIRREIEDNRGTVRSMLQYGNYLANSENDSCLFFWTRSIELGREYQAFDLVNQANTFIYRYYLDQNDVNAAARYLERFEALSDSIRSAAFTTNVHYLEDHLQADILLNENQSLRSRQSKIEAQQRVQITLIVLVALIAIASVIFYAKFRKRKREYITTRRTQKFTEELIRLTGILNNPDYKYHQFLKTLIEDCRVLLTCDRASFWKHDPHGRVIELVCKDHPGLTKELITTLVIDSDPYLAQILSSKIDTVEDIERDKRFENLSKSYFEHLGTRSMINSSVFLDGDLYGFISFSSTRKRVWLNEEKQFVSSLNDLIHVAIAKEKAYKFSSENEVLIKKLTSKNKSLQEFNDVISHNLREPLTQIMGFSYLLKHDPEGVDMFDALEKVAKAAQRIDTVVKELSIVLNDKDPTVTEYKQVSIFEVISDIKHLFRIEMSQRDIEIIEDFEVSELLSYKPFLIDIFYHLFSNSLKFSDPTKPLILKINSYRRD